MNGEARDAEAVPTLAGVGSLTGLESTVAVFTRAPVPVAWSGATSRVTWKLVLLPGPLGLRAAVVVQVIVVALVVQRGSKGVPTVVPAGIVSLMTTPAGSVEGPWLVSVSV